MFEDRGTRNGFGSHACARRNEHRTRWSRRTRDFEVDERCRVPARHEVEHLAQRQHVAALRGAPDERLRGLVVLVLREDVADEAEHFDHDVAEIRDVFISPRREHAADEVPAPREQCVEVLVGVIRAGSKSRHAPSLALTRLRPRHAAFRPRRSPNRGCRVP